MTDAEKRKRLVGHLLAIEELCDEISSRMRRWVFADLMDVTTREKCCQDLESLQAWSESTVEQHKVVVHNLMPTGDAVVTQALQTLKLTGCAATLEAVESLITKLISRMKHPMSEDYAKKLCEALADINTLSLKIQQKSQDVRTAIRDGKSRDVLRMNSPALFNSLDTVADKLTSMISNVLESGEVGTTTTITRSGDAMFAERYYQVDAIKAAYEAMLPELKLLADPQKDDNKKIRGRNKTLATDLEYLFEDLRAAVGHCITFSKQIALVEHAATILGEDLDTQKEQLRMLLDDVRDKQREVSMLMDKYRERIQLAPFRHIRRRGEPPPWAQLSANDRRVLETIIRLTLNDPEPEYFTTTRQRVEAEIGDPSAKSSIERSLRDLCKTPLRILGRQEISKSSTHQFNYFVISDALEFYASMVRPIALGSPKAP
ncbi:MAG: hypothetical protein WCJ21_06360 [Planctomycetota bacterium]